jgi:hypothetical protein
MFCLIVLRKRGFYDNAYQIQWYGNRPMNYKKEDIQKMMDSDVVESHETNMGDMAVAYTKIKEDQDFAIPKGAS